MKKVIGSFFLQKNDRITFFKKTMILILFYTKQVIGPFFTYKSDWITVFVRNYADQTKTRDRNAYISYLQCVTFVFRPSTFAPTVVTRLGKQK